MARFAPLAVLLLILALAGAALVRGKAPAQSPFTGRAAPALPLAAEFPAVINFFASWCVSCRAEQAVLERVTREHNLPVYGVAWKDTPEDTRAFLEKHGNPFTVTAQDAGTVAAEWGITGVPETFVLDAGGIVRWHRAGPVTPEIYTRDLAPLLAEMEK